MGKSRNVHWIPHTADRYWKGTPGNAWPSGSSSPVTVSMVSKQELITSSGHPYHLLGKSGRNIGGDFLAIKRDWKGNFLPNRPYSMTANPNSPGYHYDGPVFIGGNTSWPAPILPNNSTLDVLGTRAIANVLPTNPLSGLFVSLGELKRDGIPSLLGIQSWKNRTRIARSAGDEYLNYQFGWIPLVNDLKRFSHAVTNSDELIRQYERNSGRKIKRSLRFPIDSKITVQGGNNGSVMSPGGDARFCFSSTGSGGTWTQTQSIERWFEGCFTYYLPPYKPNGDNSKRNRQLANYLYGTRVTPEGIWDLTPWSWAADWVGNFGDVLHNVSAFRNDGLVMQYGYIMERSIHELTHTRTGVTFYSYPGSYSFSSTWRTIVKSRRTASPYGFGLNPDSFSDRQWAILAALGISRGSRQLYS